MPYNDERSYGASSYYSTVSNRYDRAHQTVDVERLDDDDEDSSSNGSDWRNHCQMKSVNGSASEDSSSAASSAAGNASSLSLPARNPTCALCKNHRISSPLKGHKRYCPFARCQCDLCRVTRRKQKLNASQVAIRRAIQQDKELGIERPLPPLPPQQQPPQPPPSSSSSLVNTVSVLPAPSHQHHHAAPRMAYSPLLPSMDSRPMAARFAAAAVAAAASATSERLRYEPTQTSAYPAPPTQATSPIVFGENMSLECVLLGRSASLLMNALQTCRLTHEQLIYLNHEIGSSIRMLNEEVTPHLNDIYRYLMDRLQREQAKNGATKANCFQGYASNQIAAPLAEMAASAVAAKQSSSDVIGAALNSNHIQPVRESVIIPPIMDASFPVYPQYGSQ